MIIMRIMMEMVVMVVSQRSWAGEPEVHKEPPQRLLWHRDDEEYRDDDESDVDKIRNPRGE